MNEWIHWFRVGRRPIRCFFQKESFGELIVFQYLNMDCMKVILSDLSKLSL